MSDLNVTIDLDKLEPAVSIKVTDLIESVRSDIQAKLQRQVSRFCLVEPYSTDDFGQVKFYVAANKDNHSGGLLDNISFTVTFFVDTLAEQILDRVKEEFNLKQLYPSNFIWTGDEFIVYFSENMRQMLCFKDASVEFEDDDIPF